MYIPKHFNLYELVPKRDYEMKTPWLLWALLDERVLSNEENSAIDRQYIEALKARSIPLLAQHPELKKLVDQYIENQLVECDYIEENLVGAIWLLQKKQS